MIMSRLGIYVSVLLTCASLDLTCAIGRAASATEECGQRYKICNWGCAQSITTGNAVIACKSRCDFHLIACDRQPISTAAQGGTYTPQSSPQRGNAGFHLFNENSN
jgi:hypothetical protein